LSIQPLKEKTIAGFKWNLAGQVMMYLITFGGTIGMSRLVSPSEFGLFGMLAVLSSLSSLVVGLGFAHAIVQNQSLKQSDLSSIFWVNFFLGLGVAAIFFFSAGLISSFYGQPELREITQIFSLIFLIYGCSSVPLGILTKRVDFKYLVLSQLIAAFISYALGLTMAYLGFGVWSLVMQSMVNHFIYVGLNIYFSGWTPSLIFKWSSILKITRFSRNFLPSQLLDFFALNIDMLLIGKYFGKSELGYYGRATALVQLPVNSLGLIFNKTVFSLFAELQKDQDTLVRSYLRSLKILTLTLMPILILTAIQSKNIVLFLFGSPWVAMTDLVAVLAISASIGSYNSFNDSVIVSQGRTDLLLRVNVIEKLVLITCVVVGLRFGLIGVAFAKVISSFIMFIPKLINLSRVTRLPVADWFNQQLKLFGGLILCGIICIAIRQVFSHMLISLIVSTAGALLCYYLFLILTKDTTIKDLSEFVKNSFR
jgi:teichuronic acid exporter